LSSQGCFRVVKEKGAGAEAAGALAGAQTQVAGSDIFINGHLYFEMDTEQSV
jgi:hypothetical protein